MTGLSFKGEDISRASLMFQTLIANIEVGKYLSHVVTIVRMN
jgi:hypothetical protein